MAAAVVVLAAGVAAVLIYYGSDVLTSATDEPARPISVEAGSLIVFNGEATSLDAAVGNLVEPGASSSSGSTVIVRSQLAQAEPSGKTAGVSLTIPAEVVRDIAGRPTRITVWLRQARSRPAKRFAVAYSTAGSGNSGWIVFNAGTAFSDHSFDFRIPASQASNAHYIGFWADLDGDNGGIELRLVTVKPLM